MSDIMIDCVHMDGTCVPGKCKALKRLYCADVTCTFYKSRRNWISTKKHLPPEPTDKDIEQGNFKEYIVTIEGSKITTCLEYLGCNVWCNGDEYYNVIAWQMLPEIYRGV